MAKLISSNNRPRPARTRSDRLPVVVKHNAKTNSALRSLNQAISLSPLRKSETREQIANKIVFDLLGANPYPAEFRRAFTRTVKRIINNELTPLYTVPPAPPANDPLAAHQTRIDAANQLEYFKNEAAYLANFQKTLRPILERVTTACRQSQHQTEGVLTVHAPLYTFFDDPVAAIDDIVKDLTKLSPDPSDQTPLPGSRFGNIILKNLLAASRLTYTEAQKRPHRLTWPADSKLSTNKLVSTYFAHTPLENLLNTKLSLTIPNKLLPEAVTITALPGHGKTQLLQSMFMAHLNNPANPSIVILDSQSDCFEVISRLKRFDPDLTDRLTIIDPTDIHPPALNLFAWNRDFAGTLSETQREEMLAGVIETFKFCCEGLFGSGLTPRMQLVFEYLAIWILEIPGANLNTMIELLREPEPFLQYTLNLSPTAQSFIEELFQERSQYRQTREHILSRLHQLVANPAFERMFAHTENKFDISEAMNTPGSVTLINTSKGQLKTDCSAMFGRFWLAKIYQATMARAFIPREQRCLSVILVDEAHEYLAGAEKTVEQLLFQARKYVVNLNFIFQNLGQMRKAGVLDAMLGVPALRYTGAISDADAKLFAKEMNCTPEFLKSVRKTAQDAQWAVHARNITQQATLSTVKFLEAEREPKMSADAYARLLERNRQKVGAPRQRHQPRQTNQPPSNNDGDEY